MFFGATVATDSLWVFLAMIATFVFIACFILPAEEEELANSHPNWYLYVERSPRWWDTSGGLQETRRLDDWDGIAGRPKAHDTCMCVCVCVCVCVHAPTHL